MAAGHLTIGGVARSMVREIAPDQLPYLELTAKEIFAGGSSGRNAMLATLDGDVRSRPAGFGAEEVGLVVGFLVTVLNGVAMDLLGEHAVRRTDALTARWRRRRERRALTERAAPDGLDAPLPALGAIEAANLGRRVLVLAREAGIADEQAQRIATLIAAELTAR
ncbi:hypothetical protein [Herbidospora sp. RD11066]